MIQVNQIGKKFGKHWVFRDIKMQIENGSRTALTGPNGSGKSTLLQIIAGFLTPTEGVITLPPNSNIAYSGPYTEIVEEMNLRELLTFHSAFRRTSYSFEQIAEEAKLPLEKSILHFSTGMKQRVNLSLSFYFENSHIFLDEPTSNLDQQGIAWWCKKIEGLKKDQTLIIASNDELEISHCQRKVEL